MNWKLIAIDMLMVGTDGGDDDSKVMVPIGVWFGSPERHGYFDNFAKIFEEN